MVAPSPRIEAEPSQGLHHVRLGGRAALPSLARQSGEDECAHQLSERLPLPGGHLRQESLGPSGESATRVG
jgi:hypothetical protein